MIKQSQPRLWRVEWCHRSGYQSPTYYVETTRQAVAAERLDAIAIAKTKSRLADFPKVWSIKLTKLFE